MYGEGKKKFEKYVGQFRDGMFHGRGEYYFNDGSKYVYYIIILYNVNEGFFLFTEFIKIFHFFFKMFAMQNCFAFLFHRHLLNIYNEIKL